MCLETIVVRKDKFDEATVPCGKCPVCRSRRASAWSFRLMQHYKKQSSGHFVTLTYNTENVPINAQGYMTLKTEDLQKFFKRLRKNSKNVSTKFNERDRLPGYNGRSRITYYAVGEYGTTNWRPHYHVLLFNCEIDDVLRAWRLGDCHFGQVEEAAVGYCLKYITKPARIPVHRNDTRLREKSYMSKGIGECYLSPKMLDWHYRNASDGIHCQISGGRKISIPRYYKDRIGFSAELLEQSKQANLDRERKEREKQIKKLGEEKYYRQKEEAKLQAYKKMYSPEKTKKL